MEKTILEQTKLLPPESAVRITWARTSAFSVSTEPKKSSYLIGPELSEIKKKAEEDEKEQEYFFRASAAMDSSLRNLNTVYKWRNLNFDENEKLRLSYLDYIKASLEFGNKARDYFISLPATLFGSATGIALSENLLLSGFPSWVLILAVSLTGFGIGYGISLGITQNMCARKQKLYIKMDYERSLYYKRYLMQVLEILNHLYADIDRIHEKIFFRKYPVGEEDKNFVDNMIRDIGTKIHCKYIDKHMSLVPEFSKHKFSWKVTAERWPLCETGIKEFIEKCKYWEKTP